MVTGLLPFDGESPVTIALKHIQSEPIEPKKYNASIPDSLNNLIMKAISKESVNRYQNCRELINDLQKIKENPNTPIGARVNYDDGRTIVMEPIRTENIVNKDASVTPNKNLYSKSDFENDYEEDDEDEDDDFFGSKNKSKKSKRNNKTMIILGVIVMIIALLSGIAFGSGLLSGSGVSSNKVTVPNIVGMTFDNAKKELEKLGLNIKVIETVESDKEENTILEMNPIGNTEAKKGDTIEVKVSGGIAKIKVPDLRDYEINYIKDLLTQKGLEWNITEQYSENIKSGYLISQYPERDTEVTKGTIIELTISKGPEVKLVSVSNYLGQNVDSAKSDLEALGLTVILQEQATDNESENGVVLKQSIKSGSKISEGNEITLTYGKYTAPSNIDISQYLSVGMSLVDAINSLNTAGISYSISGGTPPESDMSLYTVKGFTNKIKQGETVKIQVEKTQTTDPDEGEDDKTNTDSNSDQNTNNGEAANTNVNVDKGNDTTKN